MARFRRSLAGAPRRQTGAPLTDEEIDARLDQLVAEAPEFSQATWDKLYVLLEPVREGMARRMAEELQQSSFEMAG